MKRVPWTLIAGVLLIAACEVLLFVDVSRRGGVVAPGVAIADMAEPVGALGRAARLVAVNVTPLCWVGYLLTFDGLLGCFRGRGGSPLRRRPNRFVVAWLTSIPVWCFFDAMNFYYLGAWRYHGLPPFFSQRVVGYFIAFAAISPGMFLAAEFYQRIGFAKLYWQSKALAWVLVAGIPGVIALMTLAVMVGEEGHVGETKTILGTALLLLGPMTAAIIRNRTLLVSAFAVGIGFVAWAVMIRAPIGCMTLWVGLIFLLDPVNAKLGAPSLLRDWQAGRWGRTAALFAGGATCGLLWEFWNYWALTKWTYHLPFLGALEQHRYFEMPWLGFFGFLPFAAECWVVLNTLIALLERVGLRVAEPLPDELAVM